MSTDPDLTRFVRDALQSGASPDTIRATLIDAGWTTSEADSALAAWVKTPAGAVPRPVRSSTARDALLYALLFLTFGAVAANVLTLLFGQINYWMPEPGDSYAYYAVRGLRWSMAALIVFAPVFWILHRSDDKAVRADPARGHNAMRRWLSALAMFIAVVTLLCDLIFLIYTFLDGQMTARFLAKSGLVAVVAVIVLAYFRAGRVLPADPPKGSELAPWALVGMAALSLVLSFWVIGGPGQGRVEQRDRWRLADLHQLASDVTACVEDKEAEGLPDTLDPTDCIRNPYRLTGYATDVVYRKLAEDRFELCIDVEFPRAIRHSGVRIDGTTACEVRTIR